MRYFIKYSTWISADQLVINFSSCLPIISGSPAEG